MSKNVKGELVKSIRSAHDHLERVRQKLVEKPSSCKLTTKELTELKSEIEIVSGFCQEALSTIAHSDDNTGWPGD